MPSILAAAGWSSTPGDGNGPGALFAYDPERERWSRLTALGKVRLESMTYLSGADVFYGLSSDGVLYLIGPGGQHLGHRAVTADEVGVGNQDEVLEAIEEADESLQLVSTKDHVFVLSEDRVLPLDPVAPTAK